MTCPKTIHLNICPDSKGTNLGIPIRPSPHSRHPLVGKSVKREITQAKQT